jgi:hypothetical protein
MFEGLRLENVDVNRHLESFTDIWDIVLPFGTFCVHLVHFLRFGYHAPKNLATLVPLNVKSTFFSA